MIYAMQVPPSLTRGEKVAILSPASVVKAEYIDGAADFLRSEGFEPMVMPHAKGPASGSYAASDANRLSDILEAYKDPSIRAILCARGGYGCNHLLPLIPPALIASNPKWLIGFSDISALHALSQHAGVVSLHSPMAKHLSTLPPDDISTRCMMRILTEGLPLQYDVPAHPLSTPGEAEGVLIGGNLAVINGLSDTPFDPLRIPGPKILFIEDISEAIYAVERMLIRLQLSGRLSEVTGIIAGHFTEYRPDRNFQTMEEMISQLLGNQNSAFHIPHIPIALGFPAGHTDHNLPLPLGARAKLTVADGFTRLTAY